MGECRTRMPHARVCSFLFLSVCMCVCVCVFARACACALACVCACVSRSLACLGSRASSTSSALPPVPRLDSTPRHRRCAYTRVCVYRGCIVFRLGAPLPRARPRNAPDRVCVGAGVRAPRQESAASPHVKEEGSAATRKGEVKTWTPASSSSSPPLPLPRLASPPHTHANGASAC